MASRVIEWDGKSLPDGLRELPPGWYVVEPIDDLTDLTPEEEAGILQAIKEVEAGQVVPMEEVVRDLGERIRQHENRRHADGTKGSRSSAREDRPQ